MIFRRAFLILVVIFVLAGLFHILFPWVAAFVRHERLSRYVKVRTDYPGCVPGKQVPESLKCQCEFIFEDVELPGELTFQDSSLWKSYDPGSRTYYVTGTGTIRSAANHIVLSSDSVSINGTQLPRDRYASLHVLIKSNGEFENSRVDISW
jgi:hypothetical protein